MAGHQTAAVVTAPKEKGVEKAATTIGAKAAEKAEAEVKEKAKAKEKAKEDQHTNRTSSEASPVTAEAADSAWVCVYPPQPIPLHHRPYQYDPAN